MINQRSIDTVTRNTDHKSGAVHPLYDSYGFAGVPWAIERMLTGHGNGRALPADCFPDAGEDVDQVILLFVDGFGWAQLERHVKSTGFLQRCVEEGVVSKLTSLFPSTTCAHVTCVHSGLTPAESGLYEWFQYEPTLDALIAPLLFSFANEHGRNGLLRVGADPSMFFDAPTLHQRVQAHGVQSNCVTPAAFTPSPFNNAVCKGAVAHPYKSLSDGLTQVAQLARRPHGNKSYIHYYYGNADLSSHQFGPDSEETAQVIRRFFAGLDKHLMGKLPGDGRTMVCLVADHGFANVDPKSAVYINERCPTIGDALGKGIHGPLAPAGSPRDMFLHLRDDCLDSWLPQLTDALSDIATVHRTADLIEAGLFGPTPASAAFMARVGNVVVLPYDDQTVWWLDPGRFDVRHLGEHGGLSQVEMEIPFLALRV